MQAGRIIEVLYIADELKNVGVDDCNLLKKQWVVFKEVTKLDTAYAKTLFEKIYWPKLNGDPVIKHFLPSYINMCCNLVKSTKNYNELGQAIDKVVKTYVGLDNSSRSEFGSLIKPIIITLIKHGSYEKAFNILSSWGSYISLTDKAQLWLMIASNTHESIMIKKACNAVQELVDEQTNNERLRLFLPDIKRFNEKAQNKIKNFIILRQNVSELIESVSSECERENPKYYEEVEGRNNYEHIYETRYRKLLEGNPDLKENEEWFMTQFCNGYSSEELQSYLNLYGVENIDENDPYQFVIAIRKLLLLDFLQDPLYSEGMYLLQQVEIITEPPIDQDEFKVLKEVLQSLEKRYFEVVIESSSGQSDMLLAILDEQGYHQSVPWADTEKLVIDFIGKEAFYELQQLGHKNKVINELRMGEWVWANHVNVLERETYIDEFGQDLTFALTSYFKAVELYCYQKIDEKCNGQKFNNIIIGGQDYYRKTLGWYSILLCNNIIAEKILRCPTEKDGVKKRIQEWTDNCRNSNFHKDIIVEPAIAKKMREETKVLLVQLIKDFI